MRWVPGLYTALEREVGEEDYYAGFNDDRRVQFEFASCQYYQNGSFLIGFFTYITDYTYLKEKDYTHIVESAKVSVNEYLFVIHNGEIVKRLYKNNRYDLGCYEDHKYNHLKLVENKEPEIINCISSYNELCLIFERGRYLKEKQINQLRLHYSDFEKMPDLCTEIENKKEA